METDIKMGLPSMSIKKDRGWDCFSQNPRMAWKIVRVRRETGREGVEDKGVGHRKEQRRPNVYLFEAKRKLHLLVGVKIISLKVIRVRGGG